MRRSRIGLAVALNLLAAAAFAAGDDPRGMKVVYGESRVALVIGNSAYASSPLRNPANDARGVADLLRQRKFEVTELTNTDKQKMEAAVEAFGRTLKAGGVGLFYYAGHAMQIGGDNYLIPVGARLEKEADVKYQAVNVGQVLAEMEGARNRLNIVILDACRDNPFARSFRSAGAGLARMDAPSGTLIAYATAPGRTAADGAGEHGVYTANLLQEMDKPGQELSDLFKRVRAAVEAATANKQTPWEATSVKGNFYFTPIDVLDLKLNLTAEQLARYKQLLKEQQDAETRLKQLEATKNAELGRMNREIADLQSRLKEPGTSGGSIDQMVALVQKRKQTKDELAAAQQRAEDERRKREAEIAVLKAQEAANRKQAFETHYGKYLYLAGSVAEGLFSKAELAQAWKTLCADWRVADAGEKPGQLQWDDGESRVVLAMAGGAFRVGAKAGKELSVDLGNGVTMEFVSVPAGEFEMGSANGDSDEQSVHRVRLSKGFWMGKHEVTQAQWEQVMGSNPSTFKGPRNPVEDVSWDDGQQFIGKLNALVGRGVSPSRGSGSAGSFALPGGFRLPTEAEWEYACRAGTTTRFCNGDDDSGLDKVAWYTSNSGNATHPVGQKQANAWGLYDMHGNVWEWCQDWYGAYANGAVTDPSGPGSGEFRVERGGGWDCGSRYCRSADRDRAVPGHRNRSLGLRLARTVSNP